MKKLRTFLSGMLAMVMIMGLTGTAFAAAGKLQAGSGGIVVMDKVQVEPGKDYTVDNENIPAYVTYTGASGKTHNYVPVEMIADYLDIPTSWSETRNSVVLGPTSEGAKYQILTGEEASAEYVKTPVLGRKVGPITEVDPKQVDTSEGPLLIRDDETKLETWMGYDNEFNASTLHGKHLLLTITNHGESTIISRVGRAFTLNGYDYSLSKVKIEPGQTLTRAFAIDEDTDRIHNVFASSIMPDGAKKMNVTVDLKQYK